MRKICLAQRIRGSYVPLYIVVFLVAAEISVAQNKTPVVGLTGDACSSVDWTTPGNREGHKTSSSSIFDSSKTISPADCALACQDRRGEINTLWTLHLSKDRNVENACNKRAPGQPLNATQQLVKATQCSVEPKSGTLVGIAECLPE